MNDSMKSIGIDPQKGQQNFEKFLHVTPDDAADAILNGVKKNARRVLIGAEAYAFDAMQRLLPTGYQKLVTMGTKFMQ